MPFAFEVDVSDLCLCSSTIESGFMEYILATFLPITEPYGYTCLLAINSVLSKKGYMTEEETLQNNRIVRAGYKNRLDSSQFMHGRNNQRRITLSHPRCAPNRSGAGALELPVIEWLCDWCRGDILDGAMVANGCNLSRVSAALVRGIRYRGIVSTSM